MKEVSVPRSRGVRAPSLREEAKQYYRDGGNIEAKWLDQFGNVSRDNDYQRNRACLGEVFNMLDVVMDICIDEFREKHTLLSADTESRPPVYRYLLEDGQTLEMVIPTTFAARVRTLRMLGYPISNELFYDTRFLRNETTHGNQTIFLRHMELSHEETMKALLSMADALICLGKLDPSLREPDFEMLRVREGDILLGGAYTVVRQAGEGGMSRVYEAVQARTGRRLAVKELKPGTYAEEVIQKECDTLYRLHHDLIPQIYDTFRENGTFYIVMSFIEGETLEQRVERGNLTNAQRRIIVHGLCEVLAYLHSPEIGLVYADLSPDNIMVDTEGIPHLIDFGCVETIGSRQAVPAVTPGYSAPEIYRERILDEKTDIYSLGQILRYLYTGLSPVEEDGTPAADLVQDAQIAEVIEHCIARSPADRYASISEVRRILFPGEEILKNSFLGRHKKIFLVGAAAAVIGISALALYSGTLKQQNTAIQQQNAEMQQQLDEGKGVPSLSEEEAAQVVAVADPALEAILRELTGNETGELTQGDLWGIQMLYLSGSDVKDISVLADYMHIENLALNETSVEDLTVLGRMTSLKALSLKDAGVEDLSFLEPLENLEELDISGNAVEDLSVLGSLTNLKTLNVSGTSVGAEELEILRKLPHLQNLDAEGLDLTDCTFATGLSEKLTYLNLSRNQIQDLAPLAGLKQLKELYLAENEIRSAEPLRSLENLENLDLLKNHALQDLSPLSACTKITWLDLQGCDIKDLSALKDMHNLQSLDAADNQIFDLQPLAALTELRYLDLHNNLLTGNVDALKGLTKMETLYLQGNGISDIGGLADMHDLRLLVLTGNPIRDYSVIETLDILEYQQ